MPKEKKATCPYCYHPSLDRILRLYPRHNRSRDEIDHVHNRIRELDRSVAELSKQRAALLQKLNDVQPPISVLPAETLSMIFQLACPPPRSSAIPKKDRAILYRDPDYPCWDDVFPVLNKVSTRWSQIFSSTPQLWTSIDRCITNERLEREAAFLSQFLNNSRSLPLTLSLVYVSVTIPVGKFLHETIDAELLQNFSRIRNLHLRNPPPVWLSHSSPYLERVNYLSLQQILSEGRDPDLTLVRFPNLRELTLTDVEIPINLPSPCLVTVLNLDNIRLDIYLQLLAKCPNLVELHASLVMPPSRPDDPSLEEGVTLKHLEVFSLTVSPHIGWNEQWQDVLLNRVSFPSLRTFCWTRPYSPQIPFSQDIVGNFFASLPLTLTTLELAWIKGADTGVDFAPIIRRLRDDTSIEHLVLSSCRTSFLVDVLEELIPRDGAMPWLPRLRRLTLEGVGREGPRWSEDEKECGQDMNEKLSRLLVEMSKSRMIESDHNFVLDIKYTKYFKGFPSVREELVELRNRGCGLEILVNSVPLP